MQRECSDRVLAVALSDVIRKSASMVLSPLLQLKSFCMGHARMLDRTLHRAVTCMLPRLT